MGSVTTGKEMSARALLELVRNRKLFVLIPALVVGLAVIAYTFLQPVRYRAQALLGVEANAANYIQRTEAATRVQDQLLTIREVLLSRAVLEPVMQEFRLYPSVNGKVSDADLEKMRATIKITVEGDDSFRVGFENRDRAVAMNVANQISERFVRQLAEKRQQQVSDAGGFLDAELETLRTALSEQEEQVKRYKARVVNELPERLETNLRMYAATQAQRQGLSGARATDQARLAAVGAEMAELQKQGVLEAVPIREKTPSEVKLGELRIHLKQLRAVYTEQYPEIQATEREIKDLERAIAAAPPARPTGEVSPGRMRYLQLKAEKESLEQRLASYAQEEGELGSQMGRYQARVQSTPEHETAIAKLDRGYEATQARYNALLAKQQEVRLATGLARVNKSVAFKIVEPATLPLGPSSPRRSRLLLVGLFASLAVGLVVALVAEHMDTTFKDTADFQAFTNLPTMAALPAMAAGLKGDSKIAKRLAEDTVALIPPTNTNLQPAALALGNLHKNHVVMVTDPHSVAAEQYRLLALKIRRRLSEIRSPVLAVSSFLGGEGKTITSLNLSMALAGSVAGRVLLIDSDLRKPRVHEYLGLTASKGLSDLLLAPDDETGKYIWKLKDLYIMPGGSSLANPVSLLVSKSSRDVLERLRGEFDFIVVDTPPVLPVVDTHILAGLVDGVILVVRARHTRREMVELGLDGFQVPNLLGAVVNDVDYQRSGYGYAYQYYGKQPVHATNGD